LADVSFYPIPLYMVFTYNCIYLIKTTLFIKYMNKLIDDLMSY